MVKFEDFLKVEFPNDTKVKFNMKSNETPAWDFLREEDGSDEYEEWIKMNAWRSLKG